jgi:hypothetical protein
MLSQENKVVQKHNHGAPKVTHELLEKPQHPQAPNGLLHVQPNVSRQAPSLGRDDHRGFVASPVHQLRGLADGSPVMRKLYPDSKIF